MECLGGGPPAEAFAGLVVDLVDHVLEFFLTQGREVGVLGHLAADTPIRVLVGSALPGGVGVGEVGVHPQLGDQAVVMVHLVPLSIVVDLRAPGGRGVKIRNCASIPSWEVSAVTLVANTILVLRSTSVWIPSPTDLHPSMLSPS